MAPRASKFDFGRSLFSAADMAHASYLFRNPRTLITGDGQGGFNPLAPVERLPAKENVVKGSSVRLPKLNQLTGIYFDAWANGDRESQIETARELVSETVGIHKLQGVPLFAHLPVPWDFVQAIKTEVEGIPANERAAVARSIMSTFEPSVRPGVQRQFASQLTQASNRQSGMTTLNDYSSRFQMRTGAAPYLPDETPALGNANGRHRNGAELSAARTAPRDRPRQDYSPLGSDLPSENSTSGKRLKPNETEERLADYSNGYVAKTVDDAIAATDWTERAMGRAGMKVKGKGRYVWTRYGWVDLQHVISAATVTDNPMLNLGLGVLTEFGQMLWPPYWSSAWKTEDLLSNWIGAKALVRQRLFGGTIGEAVAFVLSSYDPLSREDAVKYLNSNGQAEPWGRDVRPVDRRHID